ncbi:MAG: hypothetical protein KBF88_03820 [Polyangiaceae bacterium]|nr:hypothetical protein [Polyangiaceae bacterium]
MSKIELVPSTPPAQNPNEARFWDERDLESELKRQFDACHNCRMCVNYCGSFPELFARVDRDIEKNGANGAEKLGAADFRVVTDHCWQCKLCFIKCPYTKDEGHEWAIDIPRLLFREKTVRAKREGVSIQDKALGEPALLGKLAGGVMAPLTNFVHSSRLVRSVMEKTAGISAEFPLPPFSAQRFETWLKHHKPLEGAGSRGTVALFATCLGDYNFPSVAANAVRVLEKNGFAVVRPEQDCCGMPNLDGGDWEAFKKKAHTNVRSLSSALEAGATHVLALQPTCGYTLRKEYPELVGTNEAAHVASKTVDVMEFLDGLRKEKTLNKDFSRSFGKLAYHAACHLRAQKIGFPAVRLFGLIPDTEVETVEQCSAVDGTWGMKAEFYEEGRKYAARLVRGIENSEASLVMSDCQLAGQRIFKETGARVVHPIEAFASAYGVAVGLLEEAS